MKNTQVDQVWGPRELDYAVHDLAVKWSAPELLLACSSFIPEASKSSSSR